MQLFKKSQEQIRLKEKQEKIENAKQSEQFRKPNPRQGKEFPEENFIEFKVIQEGKMIKLTTYRQPPKGEMKAIIFMFHGLCAHINHGAHIAEALSEIGCMVVGFDHRGFGKSEGIRGYLESLDLHLQDAKEFIKIVLQKYQPNVPIFLTGLSMGGMTSFQLSVQNFIPLRGIILFAPAIKPSQSQFLISGAKMLGAIAPKAKFISPKRGIATKNPQVSEDHLKDPHTYTDEMLPKTASTILSAMQDSEKKMHLLKDSWLLIQGELDKLVDPDVGRELMEKSISQDRKVLYYENMWHDIWHEEEILEIIPKVVEWVKERIQ